MIGNGPALLQSELQSLVDTGLPGAFIYIEDVSGGIEFHTAGVSDLATGQPMAPDAHYRIGSTTKTFTAVVVLQLVGEGRMALGDLVATWLSEHSIPNGDILTIEHLLRMRSGLFDFEDDPTLLDDLDAHLVPYTLDEVLGFGLGGAPKVRPGERYEYCNTNYCVVERVIEHVTGNSLQQELNQRIFTPLQLHNTSYPAEDDLSLASPYIRGYDWTGADWRECSHVFFGRGDGAIISTAHDVSRFFRALLDGRLLSGALLKQMQTIVPDDPTPADAYGLGLMADELPFGRVWGHAGGGFGYDHMPYLDVETGRFVICMANGTYGFRVTSRLPEAPPEFSQALRTLAYGRA